MNRYFSSHLSILFFGLAALLMVGSVQAKEGELTIEAQLVWGTNDKTSPNPKHKSVEKAVAQKLSKSPFKWQRYFEEERKTVSVQENAKQKLEMSKNAAIEIKNFGNELVEVKLIGEGKVVAKHKGALNAGEIMIIGGDAQNDTAWFIILRQVEPKK